MATLLVFVISVFCCSSAYCDLFGGISKFPGGGFNQKVGAQAGPMWGSLSQDFNKHGFSSPITVGAGGGLFSDKGSGLAGSLQVQPGIGGKGSLTGQLGLLNDGANKLNVFAQHDRFLDKNLKPIGPETNSAGLNFQHNGASAFASASQTNGKPATGTVGGSIPLFQNKGSQLSIGASTTFGHGMKPNNQAVIKFETKLP